MSQKKKILDYMRSHGSITTMEAFSVLRVTRLASRIWDLKKDGHNIVKTMVKGKNSEGETTDYASYSIKE